jgi:PAS domain S-box-containing protein
MKSASQHATSTTERYIDSLSSDGRYRLLVEAVTDYAIYMLDDEGIVTSWNPGAQRFKGYEASEIIGEHFSRFYTDEDKAAGLPARALWIAEHEGRFEGEGWRVRKDGTRFWAGIVIDPIRSPQGNLVGYAKITRDLTERQAVEEQLRQSEEQFRILVQGVTDYAIYMLDPEGNVSNWNAGAERIKGYRPDEIIGEHFSKFFIQEDRLAGLPLRALKTALKEKRFESEGWRVRKDGTRFWAHAVLDAIIAPDGKLIGFAKITRDITERRDAQVALERAQEALFQAQKLEAIGQLTGGVAHDFNNLLMAIMGSVELAARRAAGDPRQLQLLENAREGVRRGISLTQRMLAFARRQDLKVERVSLAGVVDGMADLIERSLGPGIRVAKQISMSLPSVLIDSNQLESALLNLVINARDAMPSNGTIQIKARAEEIGKDNVLAQEAKIVPGNYVCLSVIDDGEGMDAETLRRATEPFFTTKGVGKGTGLGLSMVHGMLEQLGGRLIMRSEKGTGTTVELWLPSAEGEAVRHAADTADDVAQSGRKAKVLAVDDDPLILLNIVAMLEDLGHTVLEAGSAKSALAVMQAHPDVELIITDQGMPQMTGIEFAAKVRAERPDFPIILATGYAELPPGGSEYMKLGKPYTMNELAAVVTRALENRLTK